MKKIFFTLAFFYVSLFTFDVFSQWITWQRTYGVNGSIEYGYSIVQTPDGGYIAAGRKNGMYIMRLNAYGDTIWTKNPPLSEAHAIIKTNDNNYAVMGILGDVIKININGDSLWCKPYNSEVRTGNIKQTADNNYIICGLKTVGFGLPYLLKLNSLGNIIYEKTFTNFSEGLFRDLTLSQSGNYILCGHYTDSNNIPNKLFMLETDTGGNQIWFKGYDSIFQITRTIANTIDGGYVVSGFKGGTFGTYLLKFNFVGNIVWIKYYFQNNANNEAFSVIKTSDGGFALTGTWDTLGNSNYFIYLLKTDLDGNEQWHNTYGFNNNDAGYCLRQTTDSGFAINGIRDNFQWGDIYIIKTDKNGYANPPIGIQKISSELPQTFRLYQNYPNPFNPNTKIKFQVSYFAFISLKVYNLLGQEVAVLVNEKLKPAFYETNFNTYELASGIYFYILQADGKNIEGKKMIHLK